MKVADRRQLRPAWLASHSHHNFGFEFIMLPDRVLGSFELGHPGAPSGSTAASCRKNRRAALDGMERRPLGRRTFIVESNGFDDGPWIRDASPDGGYIHSDEMTVTERWRRLNHAQSSTRSPSAIRKSTGSGLNRHDHACFGRQLGELRVPSDYATFNNQVFLPVSASRARPRRSNQPELRQLPGSQKGWSQKAGMGSPLWFLLGSAFGFDANPAIFFFLTEFQ